MSDNRKRQFVDTNILVYAHDASAGSKQAVAEELIRDLWETGDGCLSVQVMQEFYVTITRKVAHPYPPIEAAEILRDLSFWRVYSPTAEDVLGAIDLQRRYDTSFWDAMIIHSAICMDCSVLWSEDLADGQMVEQLTVKNPFK
jgi:predicted nucleic acid-binding protein